MQLQKAIVTGATGFIGSNLVRYLKSVSFAESIYGLSRSETGDRKLLDLGVTPIRYDLETGHGDEIPQDVDVVFHLAGKLSGSLKSMLKVNEGGTGLLLNSLKKSNKRTTIIILSSIAAAGPGKREGNRKESDPPSPISDYGRSKLAGERQALAFSDQFAVSIIRPGIVFGPGDKEFLRLLQTMKLLHLNPMIGKGDSPLSFIEVGDLVQLMVLVANKGERAGSLTHQGNAQPGLGVYNAATEDFLTLKDLGRLFSHTSKRAVISVPFPKSIGYCLGYAGELFSSLFKQPITLTRDKIREASAESWRVDSGKAVEQLGWQRSPTRESLGRWIEEAQQSGLL
ncbi:MAG: NAD-dependent epimerase/dehydratase family protein [Pirellula sp.]|nr:NAD-dependent epimerase/dehydratase family protein [Pirellula sp.]